MKGLTTCLLLAAFAPPLAAEPINHDCPLATGYHPIASRKIVGDARSFYTAIGHRPENYNDAQAAILLANGIA